MAQFPPPPPKNHPSPTCHPVHKTLASAANLAHLLPTGTVLGFRALTPSFSNKGHCQPSNKYLTACLIGFCAVVCFFSSFTDSFIDSDGKLYFGIATFKRLKIFNYNNYNDEEEGLGLGIENNNLAKFRICCMDFVPAFVSLIVFLVFALSDSDVQRCYFPEAGANVNALLMNLPLGAGVLASFLFMLFPTTRRGIGIAGMPALSR